MSYGTRYAILLSAQFLLIITDLVINSTSEFVTFKPELQLIVFVFQDVLLVISLTVTLISFFSTYVFQAGLVDILFEKFRFSLVISILYLFLTISVHAWLLKVRWNDPLDYVWTNSLTTLFVTQRILSPVYYYSTKRTILRISDPRYYQKLDWIGEKVLDRR